MAALGLRRFRPALLLVAVLMVLRPPSAAAEAGEIRIGRNVGLGYLPLYVMEEQHLVEQQAAADGLGPVSVTYRRLGGPAAVNDALLSGATDFAAAGPQAMILAWDRTRGAGSAGVLGLAATAWVAASLNTNDPGIRTLADFSPKDRIALPTVKVSTQAFLLNIAAEKLYGPEHADHFDTLTVSLGHPDAVVALLSGKSEITAHFATPPYSGIELQDPRIHRVTTDAEIQGERSSSAAIWSTRKFLDANPRLSRAMLAALDRAIGFIQAHPHEAAEIFVRQEGTAMPLPVIERALAEEAVYGSTPAGILAEAAVMHRVGAIRNLPKDWRELFFAGLQDRPGS